MSIGFITGARACRIYRLKETTFSYVVAISASLTNDGNLSHFNFKSHVFSTNRGEFFPHYSANRMYFQLEIKQNGNLQGRFFFLYQYSTLPLNRGFQGDNFFRVCHALTAHLSRSLDFEEELHCYVMNKIGPLIITCKQG